MPIENKYKFMYTYIDTYICVHTYACVYYIFCQVSECFYLHHFFYPFLKYFSSIKASYLVIHMTMF